MILNTENNDEITKYVELEKYCKEAGLNIEILFLYKQIEEYCKEPPCDDEYKHYFKEKTKEELMEKAKDLYKEKRMCFYPYGEGMLHEIFYLFVENE